MTIFNETNLQALRHVQEEHGYAQVVNKIQIKALYESDRLTPLIWKKLNSSVSDRRWIHALKLGLLTEDEFDYGSRHPDTAIVPNQDIQEIDELTNEEIIEFEENIIKESDKIPKSDEKFKDPPVEPSEDHQELISKPLIDLTISTEADLTEPTHMDLTEDLSPILIGQESDDQSQENDNQLVEKNEEPPDESVQEELKSDQDDQPNASNDHISEDDFEEEEDNFVSWLKTLPKVAGYHELKPDDVETQLTSDGPQAIADDSLSLENTKKKPKKKRGKKKDVKKKDVKKKDKEKDKKKRKKKEKDKKKKQERKKEEKKKRKQKKRKKKKGRKKKTNKKNKSQDSAYQDRVVGSLLLNDSIASETLAELLQKHGHHRLAREMYRRLSVNMPEKSSYFAAQIELLKEEE